MRLNLSGIFSLLLLSVSVQAKEFHLVYQYGTNKLEYKVNAKDSNEALLVAADACFDVFSQKLSIPFDQRYELIDVCANPSITRP